MSIARMLERFEKGRGDGGWFTYNPKPTSAEMGLFMYEVIIASKEIHDLLISSGTIDRRVGERRKDKDEG